MVTYCHCLKYSKLRAESNDWVLLCCVCVCVQALVRVYGVQSGGLATILRSPVGRGSNRKSICDAGYEDASTDPHLVEFEQTLYNRFCNIIRYFP